MADALALELARKGLVTDQMVLTVGYDRESLTDPSCPPYHGPVTVDHYGRRVPKAAHGSETLRAPTASSRELLQALTVLFDRIVDRGLLVRRMYVVANHVQRERDVQDEPEYSADGKSPCRSAAARGIFIGAGIYFLTKDRQSVH